MRTHTLLWLPLCAAIAGAVAVPTAVCAQTPAGDDPRANARMHIGPLYLTPGFELSEVGIDSNVLNAPEDKKADFTLTAKPAVTATLIVGHKFLLTTLAQGEGVYYRTLADQRSMGGDLMETAEVRLRRVRLFADGVYGSTRRRPSLEIDARVRHMESGFGVGAGVKLTERFSVDAAAHRTSTTFDPGAVFLDTRLRDTMNRETRMVNANLAFILTPYTTVGLAADGSRDTFPYSSTRNKRSIRVMPLVNFSPRAAITGSAAIGFRQITPERHGLPPFRGMVTRATLGYRVRESTLISFDAERDVLHSFEMHNPYFLNNLVGARIRRHLAGRFDATLGLQFVRYDYRRFADVVPADPNAPPEVPRFDRVVRYSVSLGTRLRGDTRVETGVFYTRRVSTTQDYRDFTGWRFMTSVAHGL